MRTSTQVTPDGLARFRIDVVVDSEVPRAHFDALSGIPLHGGTLQRDQLEFVGLSRQQRLRLLHLDYPANKTLIALDDRLHFLLED